MASSSSSVFRIILALIILATVVATAGTQNKISLGSSLSPKSQPSSWQSSSEKFAFGFYPQGSGSFAVGIWLVGGSENTNTVVWTANRDDPPLSSAATLNLTLDGKLVLLRNEQTTSLEKREDYNKLIADISQPAFFASMLDSGNFVLYNKNFQVIWESFNFPTDTIVGGQNLSRGHQLFSSFSQTNHSTGKFRLNMQYDGNLVLYPINTLNSSVDAYWATDTWATSAVINYLYLNKTGALLLVNGTGAIIKEWLGSSSYNSTTVVVYRATIDYDGNFRLYSHNLDDHNDTSKPTVEWKAMDNPCDVKGFCGFNSYCTFNDIEPDCRCLPGFVLADANQKFGGCDRNFSRDNCPGGKENVTYYGITTMVNLELGGVPYYSKESTSKGECSMSCLEDCDCDAALLDSSGICTKHKLPLRDVKRRNSISTTTFFKVGNISINRNNGGGADHSIDPSLKPQQVVVTTNKKAWLLILGISLGFVTYSCLALAISGFYVFKLRVLRYKRLLETGTLTEDLTMRPYSYNELRRATNGFKEKLGKGSFGAVYKGSMCKGNRLVAVKRLEKVVDEGEREFQAEMQVIGRTRHKNLVHLIGYCAEGLKRLLVYEYMSNGSLADLLFRTETRHFPDWTERVRIALDVARGLLYLHDECDAPIIHCDIKPQNILMDEFWTAKISDFGLAKLLMPDQTRTFIGKRGTRGYLAPEWENNTPITVKVDIYSYGIVLLEIVCCRRNLEVNVRPDEVLLTSWAYKCFVRGELNKLVNGGEVDKKSLDNMVKVALWCIQDEPSLRPSMKSVVLMLEGITDISVPPCPTTT